MNIFFITVIIFVIVYIFLSWFAKTSTKKISKFIRILIIILSIFLALIMAYAGRYIFSLPFVLAILPLIKTKASISLFQLLRLWGLFRVLKNSGRFNFNNFNQANTQQNMNLDEAYKILNLDPKKKYSKSEILNSYKKIMKKIHPDVSPELNRLASIVNEAKEIVKKAKVFSNIEESLSKIDILVATTARFRNKNIKHISLSDLHEIDFTKKVGFLFGPESSGIPPAVLDTIPRERHLLIPMKPGNRSLNIANSVSIIAYEAWRQNNFHQAGPPRSGIRMEN